MPAVFVNMATVLLGSVFGLLFRSKIRDDYAHSILFALGLITAVIGITGAIRSSDTLCLIFCMVLGTLLGELLKIDDRIERAGDFIRGKMTRLGGDSSGSRFTEGFVSACILFCVGSMTIMGSFEAGIHQNYSIIFTKSALDLVSSAMLAATLGLGVPFSVVFILVFQGGLTLLAGVLAPYLSEAVVTEMSAVGSTILIGMAANMLELTKSRIKVANMLPAIFLPIAYLPLADWLSGVFAKLFA